MSQEGERGEGRQCQGRGEEKDSLSDLHEGLRGAGWARSGCSHIPSYAPPPGSFPPGRRKAGQAGGTLSGVGTRSSPVSRRNRLFLALLILVGLGYAYWKFAIPTHRVAVLSELVMLGDLDGDYRWTASDLEELDTIIAEPFAAAGEFVWRVDMNRKRAPRRRRPRHHGCAGRRRRQPVRCGRCRPQREAAVSTPARTVSLRAAGRVPPPTAPRSALPPPRRTRRWAGSPNSAPPLGTNRYATALEAAVYSEAIRFDQAWRKRQPTLMPIEREYAERKLLRAAALFEAGDPYELLLALMELAEDAETLTVRGQPAFSLELLALRDLMRELLGSPLYAEFESGDQDWHAVLDVLSGDLEKTVGLTYDFESLGPPRNITNLENYLQRAEWQYYKSTTREAGLPRAGRVRAA